MSFKFDKTFLLLLKEAQLVESVLYAGLNDLNKANLGTKRKYFYSALFGLSIGVERILKLSIILQYIAINNGKTPSGNYVKQLGHRIIELREKCIKELNFYSGDKDRPIITPSTEINEIYGMLDNFARVTRYENLDRLTGGGSSIDPLENWAKILENHYTRSFTARQKIKVRANESFVGALSKTTIITMPDLYDNAMDHHSFGRLSALYDVGIRYVIWDICKLLYEIIAILSYMGNKARKVANEKIPHFSEMFSAISEEKRYSYSKKRWP